MFPNPFHIINCLTLIKQYLCQQQQQQKQQQQQQQQQN